MLPVALIWIIWSERNRRAFEGVEMGFGQLRSSLRSLVYFWCAHVVPGCIGLGVFCREPYRFVGSLPFGIPLVYDYFLSL